VWAALGVILVVGVGIGLLVLGERLQNSETVLRRFAIWEGATALWSTVPWTGVGPGGFFWHYPAFIVPAAVDEPNLLHAHNLWLNVATGWGVLGLLWLGALLTWLIGVARRLRSQPVDWIAVGALAALIASLAHAQVDAFLVLPELAAWNWLVLALLAQRDLPGFRRPAGLLRDPKQKSNRVPV
jgi:O-antigen ligase